MRKLLNVLLFAQVLTYLAAILCTAFALEMAKISFPDISLPYLNLKTGYSENLKVSAASFVAIRDPLQKLVHRYREQTGLSLEELKQIDSELTLLKFYPTNSRASLQSGDLAYYAGEKHLPAIYILAELIAKKNVLEKAEAKGRHIAENSGDLTNLCKPLTSELYKRFRDWVKDGAKQ